jgi:fumarate hydratase class II
MTPFRVESDSMEEVRIPADKLWGGFVDEETFDRMVDPAKMV